MKKRYILSTIIIVCIFTCIAVFQFNNRKYTVYADTVYFTGLSSSLSESELEAQTNTNSQNDVSNNTPMITFITHGLGGNASHWSNILVESGTVEAPTYKREFAYEPNSLIEQLRNKAGDADVYWASFDNDTNFQLVVCPIVTVSDTLYNIDSLTKVSSISSISNHIIVVFENDNDYDLSHEEIYNQFNFVADKVIYDVMMEMKNVVDVAEREGIPENVKIMIGGAPITQDFCEIIGADYYTPDAASAGEIALNICLNK